MFVLFVPLDVLADKRLFFVFPSKSEITGHIGRICHLLCHVVVMFAGKGTRFVFSNLKRLTLCETKPQLNPCITATYMLSVRLSYLDETTYATDST